MKIQNVHDEAFRPYGKVITTVDCKELCEKMLSTECPSDRTIYVASDPEVEKVDSFAAFRDEVYGGMPIQIGYCNGSNHKLNGLEYHRDSEVNVAVTDLILLLGREQDIDPETFAYDSSKVGAFLVPAGTCIEVYATTLHFAPCNAGGPVPLRRRTAPRHQRKADGQCQARRGNPPADGCEQVAHCPPGYRHGQNGRGVQHPGRKYYPVMACSGRKARSHHCGLFLWREKNRENL